MLGRRAIACAGAPDRSSSAPWSETAPARCRRHRCRVSALAEPVGHPVCLTSSGVTDGRSAQLTNILGSVTTSTAACHLSDFKRRETQRRAAFLALHPAENNGAVRTCGKAWANDVGAGRNGQRHGLAEDRRLRLGAGDDTDGEPGGGMVTAHATLCSGIRLIMHIKLILGQGDVYSDASSVERCLPPFQRTAEARWQSGYAADCNSVYAGSIPTLASIFSRPCPGGGIGRRCGLKIR